MGDTVLYYFSGTGNSLYVARELARRLDGARLVPMTGALEASRPVPAAETVGLVFPVHLANMPIPVRRFLEILDLTAARYVFLAATRIGTFSIVPTAARIALARRGGRLDAWFYLNMASNSPTGLVPGKGDQTWPEKIGAPLLAAIDAGLVPRLDDIAAAVRSRRPTPAGRGAVLLGRLAHAALNPLTRDVRTPLRYRVDQDCTGCGECVRVCPSGKIVLEAGRPVWRDEVRCWYCYACFNFCPAQAILVADKYERKDGRYRHPGTTAADIAEQKD
jgi:NAD-dependent dihydropyrimidine dehydrogenase PreA subunit/flavodoxin